MSTAAAAKPESRSDEEIQRDVWAELKWDVRVQPNEIGVSVKDGIVTLTGWVDSYAKKWAAEEAAHRVPGVKAVVNDIEVRLSGSSERSDADIAAAIVRALEADTFVPLDKLDITVSKGWVTLKGEVEWQPSASCAALPASEARPLCESARGHRAGPAARRRAGRL